MNAERKRFFVANGNELCADGVRVGYIFLWDFPLKMWSCETELGWKFWETLLGVGTASNKVVNKCGRVKHRVSIDENPSVRLKCSSWLIKL